MFERQMPSRRGEQNGPPPEFIAFARLMAATLPIGILESSSTQNDLVAAFFLLSMAERLLAWRESLRTRDAGFFAIAAGLALATKGTAYLIGLPLGLWFLAANLRAGPRALPVLIACGFLAPVAAASTAP